MAFDKTLDVRDYLGVFAPVIPCVVEFAPAKIEKFVTCKYYAWDMDKDDYVLKVGEFYYKNGEFHVTDLANFDRTSWIVDFFDKGKWKIGVK